MPKAPAAAGSFDAVLAAAERFQQLVPDAVLVGGTAAAIYPAHHVSFDDHVLDHLDSYGSAEAMRGWLRRCRAGTTEPAATLAALRREAGLSQRQLAARVGVSQAQVARVEAATAPSLSSLTRYLRALGMTPVALVAAAPEGARLVRLPATRTGP